MRKTLHWFPGGVEGNFRSIYASEPDLPLNGRVEYIASGERSLILLLILVIVADSMSNLATLRLI